MYPETNRYCEDRVYKIIKDLSKKYSKSDKKVLHLIITHYHPVWVMS